MTSEIERITAPTTPRISLALKSYSMQARPVLAPSYTTYVMAALENLSKFKGTVNGDRATALMNTISRLALQTSDPRAWLADMPEDPPVIEAVVLRTSMGMAVVHWEDRAAVFVVPGAPSMLAGARVMISPRGNVLNQKKLAAVRANAPWVDPDLIIKFGCYLDKPYPPSSLTIKTPDVYVDCALLNGAYFDIAMTKEELA